MRERFDENRTLYFPLFGVIGAFASIDPAVLGIADDRANRRRTGLQKIPEKARYKIFLSTLHFACEIQKRLILSYFKHEGWNKILKTVQDNKYIHIYQKNNTVLEYIERYEFSKKIIVPLNMKCRFNKFYITYKSFPIPVSICSLPMSAAIFRAAANSDGQAA